jgi:magnesium chelatase family protein
VLFLDELPEFSRHVLEVLREPLESGRITISRAARQADFPARFQLVAAMNPCPCGYRGHPTEPCRCTPDRVSQYRNRISGPLLDRIDLHIEVPALAPDDLSSICLGESSATIRERVARARARQIARQAMSNGRLAGHEAEKYARADARARTLLRTATAKTLLTARAFHRVLKVARTIADLGDSDVVREAHVAEALGYRSIGQ